MRFSASRHAFCALQARDARTQVIDYKRIDSLHSVAKTHSKSGVRLYRTVGSNPTPSARETRTWPPAGGFVFGSSRMSGERGPDLEEEMVGIAVAVGDALDDLDAVVDAFERACVGSVCCT